MSTEAGGAPIPAAVLDEEAIFLSPAALEGRRAGELIALTAGVLPEERAAALAAGMNDFLAKPLDIERMLAVLSPYAGKAPRPAGDILALAVPG